MYLLLTYQYAIDPVTIPYCHHGYTAQFGGMGHRKVGRTREGASFCIC